MNKSLSLALLVIGIIMIVYGFSASHSMSSGVARAITGSPSNKTFWLLAVGVLISVVGLGGLFHESNST